MCNTELGKNHLQALLSGLAPWKGTGLHLACHQNRSRCSDLCLPGVSRSLHFPPPPGKQKRAVPPSSRPCRRAPARCPRPVSHLPGAFTGHTNRICQFVKPTASPEPRLLLLPFLSPSLLLFAGGGTGSRKFLHCCDTVRVFNLTRKLVQLHGTFILFLQNFAFLYE